MPFKCVFCGEKFSGGAAASHLTRHLKKEHPEPLRRKSGGNPTMGENANSKNKPYKLFGERVPE